MNQASSSLHRFLHPRSIAFVGATERSVWSNAAHATLQKLGYDGRLYPVNRRGGEVYGRHAATSAKAIGEPVDMALLMIPAEALDEALDDLHAAGIGNAVLLSSGFAEAGAEGRARQQRLSAMARERGLRILGPNCLGFINYVDRSAVWTASIRDPLPAGTLGIVSQSGALAGQLSFMAQVHGIGLSRLVSTGNESDIHIAEVIDYLVDDPHTQSIAVFAETVRDPARFAAAAERALAAAKPIVVLKMGSSEITAQAAQAHTGSLVGDDRVFDAVCQRLGLMRVRGIEDLVFTAAFASHTGVLPAGGVAAVSMSGGMCEIMAERADEEGLALPALAPATVAALGEVLPGYGTAHNPLDVTGAAMLNPELFGDALAALVRDPGIGLAVVVADVPNAPVNDTPLTGAVLKEVARGLAQSPVPAIVCSHYVMQVTERSRALIEESGVRHIACGIHHAMSAAGAVRRWSDAVHRHRQAQASIAATAPSADRPASERETLAWLAARGVPVVPMQLSRDVDEAVRFARGLEAPVVLKIASAQIPHKTEVGGVALNLQGDAAVAEAWSAMHARVRAARPDAQIDGILVAPMRRDGLELFVGTLRDPQWGAVLAVGLGGIWVEVLQDTSLRVLPVTPADVKDMLAELRGSRLLDGWRGAPAADRDAIAEAVAAIGNAALALGPDLVSLEVNPLRVQGSTVEALDALAVWGPVG
ncbi:MULTISPECIES: acetate--CoA ligase family protein [unclassified Variovorax]|uniref:acetate--CoA ligase family protein n=1 Tax=unclassified Variovorax TaxID=663243 RepID=UPI0025780A24|nr:MULTISPECIES: acetate--CoA ligase family protein [unclassified Variovorax]MDM0086491.1 acetate--CoA ligase family protein [Variovorax sp. J22G40]MDM0145252.1 acetate--CoA ligase family protein [Variovorax sp. J2P1-31]